MTKFACGRCTNEYDRKHAPRYHSAAETSYPYTTPKTCAQCCEISTKMEICLGCALENNQCQNCRTEMFGVSERLLEQVRDLRLRFNQSVAKLHADFASLVARFNDELDLFLASGELDKNRRTTDLEGLSVEEAAERYGQYLSELKELPVALRADFEESKKELYLCLQADRDVFEILVSNAFALERLRSDLIYGLARTVGARLPSYTSSLLPEPIETDLLAYAQSQLSEEERQGIDKQRRQSFATGKQFYDRMAGALVHFRGDAHNKEGEQTKQ